jgi:aminoglycoside phosphotransferase (APT) family kinase protein
VARDLSISNLGLATAKAQRSRAYADIATHLVSYVRRVLAHLAIRPLAVSVLDSETNITLRVDAPEASYALKISPWPDDLYVSAYFFRRLQCSGLPIPQVVWFDDSRSVIPYDVQVLAWIEGVDGRALPAHLEQQVGVLLGRALRVIHRLHTDGAGSPQPDGGWNAASWREALRQHAQYEPAVTEALFRPQEIAAIEAVVLEDERLDLASPRLIHGDVVAANGLVAVADGQVRLAGIIDPGGLVGGDPMFDLAGGTDTPGPFATGLWDGYTDKDPLTESEDYRYRRLLLWSYYGAACWHCATEKDSAPWKERTLRALEELRGAR